MVCVANGGYRRMQGARGTPRPGPTLFLGADPIWEGDGLTMSGSTRDIGRNRHRAKEQAISGKARSLLDEISLTSLPIVILDHLPELVSYFDQDMRWVWLNRAQCAYYGKTREDLIGRRSSYPVYSSLSSPPDRRDLDWACG